MLRNLLAMAAIAASSRLRPLPGPKRVLPYAGRAPQYVDRVGMPHGRSGDKLVRKAMKGTVGLRHRGPYAAWHGVAR